MYGVHDLKHKFSAYSQASNLYLIVYDLLYQLLQTFHWSQSH